MSNFQRFRVWLPMAFAALAVGSLGYLGTQQVYRQSANDPQIQMATDDADDLSAGLYPATLVNGTIRDISHSSAVITTLFSSPSHVLATNATLNHTTPIPPAGTFDQAVNHGQDVFTWQPAGGVRLAAVLRSYHFGDTTQYVLVARSLKSTETREDQLEALYAIGLAVTLIGLYGLIWLFWPRKA